METHEIVEIWWMDLDFRGEKWGCCVRLMRFGAVRFVWILFDSDAGSSQGGYRITSGENRGEWAVRFVRRLDEIVGEATLRFEIWGRVISCDA